MTKPLAILALLLTVACTTASADGPAAFDPALPQVIPTDKLEFVNLNPAIRMAHAYGDRSKGAHGSFGTFPENFTTPFHPHSGAYHGVVIEGVMTNPFQGEKNPPQLSAGSYWYVPADAVHATACVSATPCKFYFYAAEAFDFTPTPQ